MKFVTIFYKLDKVITKLKLTFFLGVGVGQLNWCGWVGAGGGEGGGEGGGGGGGGKGDQVNDYRGPRVGHIKINHNMTWGMI